MELKFSFAMPAESRAVSVDPNTLYDVIIIGGGPAGLTAAVYALRKGLSIALIARTIGGQILDTSNIQNYMGYTFVDGSTLANKFFEQVKQFPAAILTEADASAVRREGDRILVTASTGVTLQSRALIIAAGKSYRTLGVPGEKELTGRGVAYCATCDAPLFAGKNVAVVGGGNSGAETALELAKIAASVTILQNLSAMTADRVLLDKLSALPNIRILTDVTVNSFEGTDALSGIHYTMREETFSEAFDGVFIEIGLVPNTSFLSGFVPLSRYGEIEIDCACRTAVPGVFAAGDITTVPEKQIIVAAGEGAKATLSAFKYLMAQGGHNGIS